MSFPFARLNAFVHRTFLGLRLRLKFFRHLERQKRNTYSIMQHPLHNPLYCRYGQTQFHVRDKSDWSKSSTFLFSSFLTTLFGVKPIKKQWPVPWKRRKESAPERRFRENKQPIHSNHSLIQHAARAPTLQTLTCAPPPSTSNTTPSPPCPSP